MDATYAATYRRLYDEHWWWRARRHVVLSALQDEFARAPAAAPTERSILDVGCGDGLFFDELSRLGDVQGVEVDASIVDPRGPWREKIWIGPFGQAYEPGRLFDAILMLDVLEHLAEPVAALRHAKKLLAGGGFLLLTVPAFMTLWTSHDALNHHYVRYTRRSLKGVASAAGLRLVDSRFFFHWVYPAKLAVRLKERLGICPQPAPPQVPPALLNRALYGLTRVEEALLGRLRLPLGSSLLAVLR